MRERSRAVSSSAGSVGRIGSPTATAIGTLGRHILRGVALGPDPLGAPHDVRDDRHVGRDRHPRRAGLELLEFEAAADGGLGVDTHQLARLEGARHAASNEPAPLPRSTGMCRMPRMSGPPIGWSNTSFFAMNRTLRPRPCS